MMALNVNGIEIKKISIVIILVVDLLLMMWINCDVMVQQRLDDYNVLLTQNNLMKFGQKHFEIEIILIECTLIEKFQLKFVLLTHWFKTAIEQYWCIQKRPYNVKKLSKFYKRKRAQN